MLPALQIGPLSLPTAPLALLLGIWLGLELAEKNAHRCGLSAPVIYNLVLSGIIGAVVGARLSYIITYSHVFLADPLSMLSPNPALLDPWGAALGAGVIALIYAQRRGLPLWRTLDALTPFLQVLMLSIAVMHFASGDAYGAPTSLPWGISLLGEKRHPTQIYEIFAAGAILMLLWPARQLSFKPGQYFLAVICLSALARLVIEAFRADSLLLPYGIRLAQAAAWGVLALGLLALAQRQRAYSTNAAD